MFPIKRIDLVVLIGFSARLVVAAWNGFLGPSFGAELDALSFHLAAIENSRNLTLDGIGAGRTYSHALGLIYYLTSESLFIGSLLSCLAWLASAQMLRRSLAILAVNSDSQVKAMLYFSLLPSSVMFTAVTLREPFQLLLVNIAVNALLVIYFFRANMHWITLITAIAINGALHGGLLAFGLYLLAGALLLVAAQAIESASWGKTLFWWGLSAAVLFAGFLLFNRVAYDLSSGLVNVIETYQNKLLSMDARTNYTKLIEVHSLNDLIGNTFIGFFQYLFEPLPWRVVTASDFVVLLENVLRAWLLWKAGSALRKVSPQERNLLVFLIISYLVLEAMWSIGTTNWGTAVRHHLPAFGLLLLIANAGANRNGYAIGKWIRTTRVEAGSTIT